MRYSQVETAGAPNRAARRELREAQEGERLNVLREQRGELAVGLDRSVDERPQAGVGLLERGRRHQARLVGAQVVERQPRLVDRAVLDRDERIGHRASARLDGPRAGTSQPSARNVSMLIDAQFWFGW